MFDSAMSVFPASSRRMKRLQLAEQNVNPLWHNTPSPPPGSRMHDDAPLPDQSHALKDKGKKKAKTPTSDSNHSSDTEEDKAKRVGCWSS